MIARETERLERPVLSENGLVVDVWAQSRPVSVFGRYKKYENEND